MSDEWDFDLIDDKVALGKVYQYATVSEIAKKFNISRETVRNRLIKYNISRRSQSSTPPRSLSKDDTLLDVGTENMHMFRGSIDLMMDLWNELERSMKVLNAVDEMVKNIDISDNKDDVLKFCEELARAGYTKHNVVNRFPDVKEEIDDNWAEWKRY